MTKYVKLTKDRTGFESAIFAQKPNKIRRFSDNEIHNHDWFVVKEHKPSVNRNLYDYRQVTWDIEQDNCVHIYYEVVDKPLDDVRKYVIEKIDRRCEAHLSKPIKFNSFEFDKRDITLIRVLGIVLSASLDESYTEDFITTDNRVVTLQHDEIIEFGKAFFQDESKCVFRGRELKNQVLESDDPLSIDIHTGWPDKQYRYKRNA